MTMEMQALSESAPSAVEREENKKRGFTLTEIAIVLGIIGLILGAIWVAAAAVYTNMRVARSNQELLQITQSVRSLFATATTTGQADGANMTISLIPAGTFPTDALPSGATSTQVNAPWSNGLINVWSATDTVAGDSFQVQFENIPSQGCINLLVSNTGSGRDPGIVSAGKVPTATTVTAATTTSAATYGYTAIATSTGTVTNSVALSPGAAGISASNAATWCGTANTTAAFKFHLRV